jgi:hypothetical protein
MVRPLLRQAILSGGGSTCAPTQACEAALPWEPESNKRTNLLSLQIGLERPPRLEQLIQEKEASVFFALLPRRV